MSRLVSRRHLLLAAGVAFVPGGAAYAAPQPSRRVPLFTIERSKNKNVVRYDLRLDNSGFYDVRRPLDVYWSMLAEDGRRSELSALEWRAYGFELLPNAKPTELGVRLVAVKDRPLSVRRRNGVFRTEIPIGGQPAFLDSIFVATREVAPVPRVLYVELRGRRIADERPLKERLEK
ncbi:MAG TPA: DUF4833 domain-containing protein [Polyangiaceae bacterium]|nr:DUF4833 domain-containing protein [Polyangiaceae bacterium]